MISYEKISHENFQSRCQYYTKLIKTIKATKRLIEFAWFLGFMVIIDIIKLIVKIIVGTVLNT